MKRTRPVTTAGVERLEARTFMSVAPLSISEVAAPGGTQLRIVGTAGNDQITVTKTSTGLLVGDLGWTQTVTDAVSSLYINGGGGNNSVTIDASVALPATVFGGGVNDTLVAGSGNTTLYGGSGTNVLKAGSGNDTLVTLGSVAGTVIGGSGHDTFWVDNKPTEKILNVTATEIAIGAVHRVSGYINVSTTAARRKSAARKLTAASTGIKEPAIAAGQKYANFAKDPLFASTGPSANDVFQGSLGDCYYMAVLSSIARVAPARITSDILDMGDGTAVVALDKNGKQVFVHEDEQLPVNADGSLANAGLGQQNCTWVALMEKAFCYVRTNSTSYAGIDGGWMDEAYKALGATPTSTDTVNSATDLATLLAKDLSAGWSVTYATPIAITAGSNLVVDHAYTVMSVTTDSHGDVTGITLRNPWGCDINGNGNGYVKVSPTDLYNAFSGVVTAAV